MRLRAVESSRFWYLIDDNNIVLADFPKYEITEQVVRRLEACWNACLGIPTETLEAGVVVVPVELAQRLLKRCREQQLEHERLSEQAADTGMFLSAEAFAAAATEAEADADALEAILSRLQQNGGEAK